MIYITQKAKKHFISLLKHKSLETQIRIFVKYQKTQKECGICYCLFGDIKKSDIQINFEQFYIYINFEHLLYLQACEIDIILDNFSAQLTLKAPNMMALPQHHSLHEKLEAFINKKINPSLAIHNGKVSLIEITKDNYAALVFSGGCNGCSMSKFTLTNIIEQEILKNFAGSIEGVRDVTQHQRGKHSYL